jgi:hypothetical protein
MIDSKYFKEYRSKLGFSNQQNLKKFFGAKDIIPTIDFNYIELLNNRLIEIIKKTNNIVHKNIKVADIEEFINKNIINIYLKLKKYKIIEKLNNQGRRPEQVYFSWMRGYIVTIYFFKALSLIFEVNIPNINIIGDDNLKNIDSFKRTPTADLEIKFKNNKKIRLEIQAGFQGINDIKQHKVLEAKKIFLEEEISTIAIHFDLFNGQVAFIRLDTIKDNNINWITRQQMEGQTVFNIDQNYFLWKLTEEVPKFSNLNLI